jgi:hypothetical protein
LKNIIIGLDSLENPTTNLQLLLGAFESLGATSLKQNIGWVLADA